MIRNLLESLDNNQINSYYTQFNSMLDMILGGEGGQATSVETAYTFISSKTSLNKILDGICKCVDYGGLYHTTTAKDDKNVLDYKRKYLYLAARAIPRVAHFIKDYASKFDNNKVVEDIDKYIVYLSEHDQSTMKDMSDWISYCVISSVENGIKTRSNARVVEDNAASELFNDMLQKVVNEDFLKPSTTFINSLLEYINRTGFSDSVQVSAKEKRNAIWIISGYVIVRYINENSTTISKNSASTMLDASRQIFGAVLTKYRDHSHSANTTKIDEDDAILIRDADASSTTASSTLNRINGNTLYTANYVVPLICKNYGKITAADALKKGEQGKLAEFRLAVLVQCFKLRGIIKNADLKSVGKMGMGNAIDNAVNSLAKNVYDVISFREEFAKVINDGSIDEIANKMGINEAEARGAINQICSNFVYLYQHNSVTGKLNGQDVVFDRAAKLPCIGSDDTSDRTTTEKRLKLTTNGQNVSKLFSVDGDTNTLVIHQTINHDIENQVDDINLDDISSEYERSEQVDTINLDDISRDYVPPFLVDVAATSGKSFRSWSALVGIVPFTGVRNGTALDSISLSDVNEKMSDRIYNGMMLQDGEDDNLRLKERLNNPEFRNILIRSGFADQSYEGTDYYDSVAEFFENYRMESRLLTKIAAIAKKYVKAVNVVKQNLINMNYNVQTDKGQVWSTIRAVFPTIAQMVTGKDIYIKNAMNDMVCNVASRSRLVESELKSLKIKTSGNTIGFITGSAALTNAQKEINLINILVAESKSLNKGCSKLTEIGNDAVAACHIIPPLLGNAYRFADSVSKLLNQPIKGLDKLDDLYKRAKESRKDLPLDKLNEMAGIIVSVHELSKNYVDADGNLNKAFASRYFEAKQRVDDIINQAMKNTGNSFAKDILSTVKRDASVIGGQLIDIQHELASENITPQVVANVLGVMNQCCIHAGQPPRYNLKDSTFADIYQPISALITLRRTVNPNSEDVAYESNDTDFDTVNGYPDEVGELRPDADNMLIARLKDEIESEGHIELSDEELAIAAQRDDDVDELVHLVSRLKETISAKNDIDEQLAAFKEEIDEATAANRNVGQLNDVLDKYSQMSFIATQQISDANERVQAFVDENPEMAGFADALMSDKVTGRDVQIANSVIANSAEVLAELTKDENGRMAYTSSDQATLAQIIYVLGAYILYPDSDINDTVDALESLRDIISNDSGNPVSLAAIDKVCSSVGDGHCDTVVKLLVQLGNVFMGDENEIIGDYVNNVSGLKRHGDFNGVEDNGIDAFARTQLRSSELSNKSSVSTKESKAREAYVTGVKNAMMSDIDLAEFAYAIGMISGTFDRSLTDERYSDDERIGRRKNSYMQNISSANLLFGDLAKNDVQREVLNAIIDDERAGNCGESGTYPRLREVVDALIRGDKVNVYAKNYSNSSIDYPHNSRTTFAKDDLGQHTFAQIINEVDPSTKNRKDLPTDNNVTDSDIVTLVKIARNSIYNDIAKAIVNGGSETDKYKKIALAKLRDFITDLDTPISEIITATTSIGQKIGGDIMIDHNKNRLINYASSRNDDCLMDDLPRMVLQQNNVIPQKLSDKLSEVDEYWINSVARVVAKLPDDISLDDANMYVNMYYGSENDINRMLRTVDGEAMYRVIHALESLDTESGLPHGFFGDNKSERRNNFRRLMNYIFTKLDGTNSKEKAISLRDEFMRNRESGSTDLNIGIRPSEATRRKIAHMRIAPSIARAIESETFIELVEIMQDYGYVSAYKNHIITLENGVKLDDNTFKQLIERTMTSMIMYNLNAAANGQDVAPDALMSTTPKDIIDWALGKQFGRFLTGLDYTIAQSRTGYMVDKISDLGQTVNESKVSDTDVRDLFKMLANDGILSVSPSHSMVKVANVGYTPIMIVVDSIRSAASTVENAKENYDAFKTEFNNVLVSLKNTDEPIYDLEKVTRKGNVINDDESADDDLGFGDGVSDAELLTPVEEQPKSRKQKEKSTVQSTETSAAPVIKVVEDPAAEKTKRPSKTKKNNNPLSVL